MKTLERYIFRKMAWSGLGGAVAIFAVVWVSQAVTRIDFATGSGQGIMAFLALLISISPQLIAIALPFGLLIGMVQTLNQLNGNAELPVMAGSGVSRWSIAKPVMILAGCASIYTLLSAHFIEPYANQAKRDLIVEARSQLLSSVIAPGQFRRLEQDMTIYIDGKEGPVMTGMMMSDTRDPDNELTYYSQTAQLNELDGQDVLLMQGGQIHRKKSEDAVGSIISFETYGVSLADFTASDGQTTYKINERPTYELLAPDPDDSYMQRRALEVRGEFHRRMSDWLYPIVFALLALVFSGQPTTSRRGHAIGLGMAFLTAVGYRGLSYYIYGESASTPYATPFFYAVPFAGMTLGVYMFHNGLTPSLGPLKPDRWVPFIQRFLPARKAASGDA